MTISGSNYNAEAFFHRDSTHELVDVLSKLDDVVIYIGAGVSIERTGLTWEGLSAQLIESSAMSYSDRIDLVRSVSPLEAASGIAEQIRVTRGDSWRAYMKSSIQDKLYRGIRSAESENVSKASSDFYDSLVALAIDLMIFGTRVTIVTPNYDDFLLTAIDSFYGSTANFADHKQVEVFGFGVDSDGNSTADEESIELLGTALEQQDTLCIVHLHGFIERPTARKEAENSVSRARLADLHPVVTESDYARTRAASRDVLRALFDGRDLVIFGSSVTDPPLINALLDTKDVSGQRFAIEPLQPLLERGDPNIADVVRLKRSRYSHLGLQLIPTDYYFQSRQIAEEWRENLTYSRSGLHYADPVATHRYGKRLRDWWIDWSEKPEGSLEDRQETTHNFLKTQVLREVNSLLATRLADENLKIEAWLRWDPEERELALWASSVGTRTDFKTRRRESISIGARYVATKALLNGGVTFASGGIESPRWKSFLAVPIRILGKERLGSIPVGVISIASNLDPSRSAINSEKRDTKPQLLRLMDAAGSLIFDPEFQ